MGLRRLIRDAPAASVIFASTLVAVMGIPLISPALPAVQAAWNISDSQASLLLSAFTLPGIVLSIPIGLLADRIGRKPVLIAALITFGLSGATIVVVFDYWMVLALRVIQGAANSAIMVLTITLLGDLYTGDQRRSLIGVNATILAIGAAGYPLLGGVLASVGWFVPFACFIVALLIAIPGYTRLEEPARTRKESRSSIWEFVRGPTPMKPFVVLYLAIFLLFVVLFGAQFTTVPFLLDNKYDISSSGIGLLLGVPAVMMGLTAIQGDRIFQFLTNFQSIALGFVSYGVGLSVVALAESIYLVAGGLVLFGLGQGLAEPITDTALSQLAPEEFRGSIMSVRTSILRLGTTVGPPIFAGAAASFGYETTLAFAGATVLVVGLTWFTSQIV